MKKHSRLIIAGVVLAISYAGTAPRGRAQMAVFDAASFGQLVSQLEQGAQQLTQLQQQLTAQLNMVRSLPGTIAPGVVQLAQQTQQLMQQINTIQNMGTNLNSELTGLYPSNYSNLTSVSGVIGQIASMQTQTRSAYQNSVALQSQVAANQPQITAALKSADTESMTASGPTAATQANTQVLETMSQQLGDTQALLISQFNAQEQKELEAQSQQAAAAQADSDAWQYTPPANVSIPNPFPNSGN